MMTADEILAAFNALPPNDKWSLLGRAWAQFPPEAWPKPGVEEIALLDARFAEIDAGVAESIPKVEVQRQIREHLKLHD